MKSIDLNDVSIYVYIVRAGGIGKASKALQLPKSTISRRLKTLESQLGLTLIQRNTRQLQVTRAGQEFYSACDQAIQQIESAEKSTRMNITVPQGLIRITTPAELERTVVQAFFLFQKKFPLIELEIQALDRNVDLIGEGFDLALRAGQLPDSSMKSIKLSEGRFILIASPDYSFERKTLHSPHDLAEHRCLLFTGRKDPHLWKLSDGKKTVTIKVPTQTAGNSALLIKQLAIEGGGIAFLPESLVKDSLISGELVRILPSWSGLKSSYHLIYPQQKNLPQKVRLFIDHMKDFYAEK